MDLHEMQERIEILRKDLTAAIQGFERESGCVVSSMALFHLTVDDQELPGSAQIILQATYRKVLKIVPAGNGESKIT